MRIEVPVSLLVRDGGLAWSCGQCPLDRKGRVLAPDDPVAQSRLVCDGILEVLRRGGLAPTAIAKLLVYVAAAEAGARERMLAVFRERFGAAPLLLPVSLPHFYYPGMCVEVDLFASTAPLRRAERRDPASGLAIELVDGGDLAWVTLTPGRAPGSVAGDLLGLLLGAWGLSPADLLCDHWFLAPGDPDSGPLRPRLDDRGWEGLLADPGAAVRTAEPWPTGVTAELTFVRGGAAATRCLAVDDGAVVLSLRSSGDFLWAGARSIDARLDLVGQTEAVMETLAQALAGHGLGFQDVVKSTTHYVGAPTPEDLHRNLAVRNRRYWAPGPASTGVPVLGLADPRSLIAVDLTVRRGASASSLST